MIDYRPGKYQLSFIWTLRGSVFPRAVIVAAPSAFLAVVFKALMQNNYIDIGAQNTAAYSGFSFVVGFLLVFRTSQAYTRFWDGATKVHEMRSKWCDACGSLIAFSRKSKKPMEEVQNLQHLFIRLFSLMHSLALQQIAVMDEERFVVIDITSLDKASLEYIRQTAEHVRVEVVLSWIHQLIVLNLESGLLPVPPPILSRVFQELSNGMVSMSNAMKISSIPFPFPYAQMTSVFLIFHWLLTPMLMCTWTPNVFFAFVFTFAPVFSFWCINMIAAELEQPFGDDVNDLPMHDLQHEMNESLLLLVDDGTGRMPSIGPHANLDVEELRSHPASSRPFTSINFSELRKSSPKVTNEDKSQEVHPGDIHPRDIKIVVHPVANKVSEGSPLQLQNLKDQQSTPKTLPPRLSNGPIVSPGPNAEVARDAITPDPRPHQRHYHSPQPASDGRPNCRMGGARSPGLIAVRTPEQSLRSAGSSQLVCPENPPSSTDSPIVPQARESKLGGMSFSPCRTERTVVGIQRTAVGAPNLETRTSHPSKKPKHESINLEALDVPDEEPTGIDAKSDAKLNGGPSVQGPFGRGLQALVKHTPEVPPMPPIYQYEGGMYITDLVDFGLDPNGSYSPR